MTDRQHLQRLREVSEAAAFNRWLGLEVAEAAQGRVTLTLAWRQEFGQYVGYMHAGVVGALIDTACGFAGATVAPDGVLASHFSVNCIAPAVGDNFAVVGEVVKAGRKQVFTRAELFAESEGRRKLVATGEAILVPVAEGIELREKGRA